MREITNPGKWFKRFLNLSLHVAEWSKDTTKVGCVITDSKNRIISIGYNGEPRKCKFNILEDRDVKLLVSSHAELNAILFSQQDLTGSSIYITHNPCSQCAAAIIQSGIEKVVCYQPSREFNGRWKVSTDMAAEMFEQAGITYIQVNDEKIESEKCP